MKHLLAFIFLAQIASAAPGWITETPYEFITTGRFQSPSDGTDLLVVDKTTGLARLGLKDGSDMTWSELPTGMSAITGLTTLRNGSVDAIAASSAAWNAIQLVSPDGSPQTLISPVVGPHALVRLSTGHATAAVVEDILTISNLGNAPDVHQIAALTHAGASLFIAPVSAPPITAQFLSLSLGSSIPVLASSQGDVLRVDRMNRVGILAGGFDVTGPHAAGILWAAAETELFSIAKDSLTLEMHRLASGPAAPGFTIPTGVALTTSFPMPELVIGLDAIPFTDPTYPALRCLVGIRFASVPDVVHLYRLLDNPTPAAEEMMALTLPAGENFAGLVAAGNDFFLLSGPGGRVASWKRFAQPGPGQLPVEVASGTLPSLYARAASPNIFIFNDDPFTSNGAFLISSQNRLNWTTIESSISEGETDSGPTNGLGGSQNITVTSPAGFPLGNQILPSVSLAGLGAVAAVPRTNILFSPPAGAYPTLAVNVTFKVHLSTTSPTAKIYYRLSDSTTWTTYSDESVPAFTDSGVLIAYSIEPATGIRSSLFTATYTFGLLPPAVPATAIDANSNGLSDAWERAFGITDPNSDTDGDGFNAITEQNYGSDPLDAASHPPGGTTPEARIAIVSAAGGHIILTWPAGLIGYILEFSQDLDTWYPVSPQSTSNSWSELITGSQKFYRLRKL